MLFSAVNTLKIALTERKPLENNRVKEGIIKLSLCLTKHHAMNKSERRCNSMQSLSWD